MLTMDWTESPVLEMDENDDSMKTTIVVSPGLTQYYTPECDSSFVPVVGMTFKNILEAAKFYRIYASKCGFDTRLATTRRSKDGTVTWKYILCNREGDKNATSGISKRHRVSKRVGCMARVIMKFSGDKGYVINFFEDRHSHPLVSDKHKGFLKANRKIGLRHKNYILSCARANIGPMRSYKLYNEVVGGQSNIGCTKTDVKNFARDLRAYIVGADAQMALDNLFKKRDLCSGFFFEYVVDGEDKLRHIFWADPISRRNFAAFGDSVSFDATYETNRYKMVFTPFTGKDNHGKLVTFGAALLSSENADSYSWVFEKFKDCMGRSPDMIITDQDPALKCAVAKVFPGIRHRLCMWHIMLKVSEKVPSELKKDKSLRDRLNKIVWSDFIDSNVFEEEWKKIMTDFGLTEISWFNTMYAERFNWIPAYFRDHHLSGLCRTTSISESANSFYGSFVSSNCSLVEFFMKFNSAIEAQRYAFAEMNCKDESTFPSLETPLLFEKHAATVYTTRIFSKVQKEIYSACFKCRVKSIVDNTPRMEYEVKDGFNCVYKTMHDSAENTFVCSCAKFIREGLLCCHIFLLMKDLNLDKIPDKYIVPRWTRTSCFDRLSECLESVVNCAQLDENKVLVNKCMSEFYEYIGAVDGDSEKMGALLQCIRDMKDVLKNDNGERGIHTENERLFHGFYGSALPAQIDVLPPDIVITKGSCSGKKQREISAIERSQKPLRTCAKCKKKCRHDARNCGKSKD